MFGFGVEGIVDSIDQMLLPSLPKHVSAHTKHELHGTGVVADMVTSGGGGTGGGDGRDAAIRQPAEKHGCCGESSWPTRHCGLPFDKQTATTC